MAVTDRFKTMLEWTQPTERTQRILDTHRSSVTARLNAAFDTAKIVVIGSNKRGTAVAAQSDIDLLLVLRRDEVTWGGSLVASTTVLGNVRKKLEERFASTNIGRDGQAIVIEFADGEHPVDVVPAVYAGPGIENYPTYRIPDGDGGWMLMWCATVVERLKLASMVSTSRPSSA